MMANQPKTYTPSELQSGMRYAIAWLQAIPCDECIGDLCSFAGWLDEDTPEYAYCAMGHILCQSGITPEQMTEHKYLSKLDSATGHSNVYINMLTKYPVTEEVTDTDGNVVETFGFKITLSDLIQELNDRLGRTNAEIASVLGFIEFEQTDNGIVAVLRHMPECIGELLDG